MNFLLHSSLPCVRIASQRFVNSYHWESLERNWVFTRVYTKLKQLVTSLCSTNLTNNEIKLRYTLLQPNYQIQICCSNSATLLYKLSTLTPNSQSRYQHPPLSYYDVENPHCSFYFGTLVTTQHKLTFSLLVAGALCWNFCIQAVKL